jgi:hypothetical protein
VVCRNSIPINFLQQALTDGEEVGGAATQGQPAKLQLRGRLTLEVPDSDSNQ